MAASYEKHTTNPTVFGIIGGGWRAAFYLRVARELPDRLRIAGMVVRDAEKGRLLEDRWGVRAYRTLDDLLEASNPSFVVLCVPWPVTPVILRELASRGLPVLAETPPAPDLAGMIALHELTKRGSKIQVAEQYRFQPLHAARLSIARSGRLGTVNQAQISLAHGYHGMSLMRGLLNIQFERATVWAHQFVSPIVVGPDRGGPPVGEGIKDSVQTIAYLDFGDRLGVYDFTGDQYFSWIRSPRVLVRGERGEICNRQVKYVRDFQTPVYSELRRIDAGEDGNLEGYYHKGIVLGEEWAYRNPFVPARLTDDEIAVATCLEKMATYVEGGPSFYGLPEASQDHYLGLVIQKAVETGTTVATQQQPWMEEGSREN